MLKNIFKYQKYSWGLIVLLFLSNIFLLYKHNNLKINIIENDISHIEYKDIIQQLSNRIVNNAFRKLNNENVFQNKINLCGITNESFSIEKILNTKNLDKILVFYFSEKKHCNSCIVESILNLKNEFKSKNEINKVIIIVSDGNKNQQIITKNKFQIEFDVFAFKNVIPKELTNSSEPLFFTINKSNQIKNIYNIQYDLLFINKPYLSEVKKIL